MSSKPTLRPRILFSIAYLINIVTFMEHEGYYHVKKRLQLLLMHNEINAVNILPPISFNLSFCCPLVYF
jgi:hypothetical protein